jgi:hypothetical protein
MGFTTAYALNKSAGYAPATWRGAWDDAAGAVTKALSDDYMAGGEIAYVSRAETVAANPYGVALLRLVSGPLASQTLQGTLNLLLGVSQQHSDSDFNWHVHAYVTQGDSDTPRGTLVTDYEEDAGTNEWPTVATGKPLNAAVALSELAIQDGDRLVIEIGYTARNTFTASTSGRVYYGTLSGLYVGNLTNGSTAVSSRAGFVTFSSAITQLPTDHEVTRVAVRSLAEGPDGAAVSRVSVRVLSEIVTATPADLTRVVVRTLAPDPDPSASVSRLVVRTLSRQFPLDPCAAPPDGQSVADLGQHPLLWVNFNPGDGMRAFDQVGAADPSTYFGGRKRPWLLSLSEIRRAASDHKGNYEVGRGTAVIADPELELRAMLSSAPGLYFPGRDLGARMVSDPGRRAEVTPRLMAFGQVDGEPRYGEDPVRVELPFIDVVGGNVEGWGLHTEARLPKRACAPPEFPYAREAVRDLGVPFPLGIITDVDLLSPPTIPPPPTNVREGDVSNPTDRPLVRYRYWVTQANSLGESDPVGPVEIYGPDVLDDDHWVEILWDGDHERYAGVIYGRKGSTFASDSTYWLDTETPSNPGGAAGYHRDKNDLLKSKTSPYWIAVKQSEFPPAVGEYAVDPVGAFEPVYVGDVVIGGVSYVELLVSGAAIEGIDEIYLHEGETVTELSHTDADLLVPGTAAWTAAFGLAPYRDVAGTDGQARRRVAIYAKGDLADQIRAHYGVEGITLPEGVEPAHLQLNLRGVEDVGNGSGEVITDQYQQDLWVWNHLILGGPEGYLTGEWSSPPMFPEESYGVPDVCMVNRPSFCALTTLRRGQLPPDGYVGARVIGGQEPRLTVREWIGRMCRSGQYRVGPNRFWQVQAQPLVPTLDLSTLPRIRQVEAGTGAPIKRTSHLVNVLNYTYAPPLASAGEAKTGQRKDATSIGNYRREVPLDYDFPCLRDPSVVEHAAGEFLRFARLIPTYVEPQGDLGLEAYDLADGFLYNHPRGDGPMGYVDRPFVVVGRWFVPGANGERRSVRLEAMDAGPMLDLVLTAAAPGVGPVAGGTLVTLTGSGFIHGMTVTFSGEAATDVTVVDYRTLTCRTPAVAAAGSVDVVVTRPTGDEATVASGFTYEDES